MGGLSDRIRTRDVEEFFSGYGKILDISLKQKYGNFEVFFCGQNFTKFFQDLSNLKINTTRKMQFVIWMINDWMVLGCDLKCQKDVKINTEIFNEPVASDTAHFHARQVQTKSRILRKILRSGRHPKIVMVVL